MRSRVFIVRPIGVAVVVALAACSHPAAGHIRYANQEPVWRVNDRVQLKRSPDERPYYRSLYHVDGYVLRRATRAMDMEAHVRAQDVNSLDEVPDSTWFTNRIGVRDVSIDELRFGPNDKETPFDHLPWTIISAKVGGTAIGFVFEDSAGDKYLLKFDLKDFPETETGAHMIVHRIAWACGFNVPQDYIGLIRRTDLRVGAKATKKSPSGKTSTLTEEEVDRALQHVYHTDDGSLRVLASRFLPGKPIGPYAREGKRADDPNDLIPHERRRSLRGQYSIFAWLNHTDMQEDNTLDAFVENKDKQGEGFVVHYLIDFGKALGVMSAHNSMLFPGHTYRVDTGMAFKSLLTFGLWRRPWDDVEGPNLRGIGRYEVKTYDPGNWRANSMYWPYEDKDRFDAFWGAKILIRFTREQLAAIVEEARYTDPRSSAYMLETLIARQRKTARYWFRQVAPLDGFEVEPGEAVRLCFDDLALKYELDNADDTTRYQVGAFDGAGKRTGDAFTVFPGTGGRTCASGIVPGAGRDGYTIVRFDLHRNVRRMPPTFVHLARDGDGTMRVIGLRRE